MKSLTVFGRALMLAAVLVVGTVYMSCEQAKTAKLVGRWVCAECSAPGQEMELFSGGTGLVSQPGMPGDVGMTWKVENKRVIMMVANFGMAYDYKVSGYELILMSEQYGKEIFVKKGKLEEYKRKKADEKINVLPNNQ